MKVLWPAGVDQFSYVVSISAAPARTYQIYIVHEGSMASWC